MIERPQILRAPSISRLLMVAALLHLILTIGVYTIGRLRVVQSIDRNGCINALTPDSPPYLSESNSLSEVLTRSGPIAWLKTPAQLHVRLYSVSIAVLRPLLGANVLSVFPVNLTCYISILWLTFKLGSEVFDWRKSLAATVAVALWPSFFLHSTQLLKDPIFITALLTLVLIMTWWLTRTLSWLQGFATGIAGIAAIYAISLTRSGFWVVVLLVVVITGACLLVIRLVQLRHVLWWNMFSAASIVAVTSVILVWAPERLAVAVVFDAPRVDAPANVPQNNPQSLSLRDRADFAAQRLSLMRRDFVKLNKNSGSDIDPDVEFVTALDVVKYLPRAFEIGFLAPFPNQWFKTGKTTGLGGRVLSGLEMSLFYIVEILALIGLWRSSSNLSVWLLCLVCMIGVGALSLAAINLGALYRLRYGFFILLVILGSNGLMLLIDNWNHRKRLQIALR